MRARRPLKPVELIEFDDSARRLLGRHYPEVAGHGLLLAIGATAEMRANLRAALEEIVLAVNEGKRIRTERLIESLLPPVEIPTAGVLEDARRQALLRSRVLRDFGACTAKEIAELAGSDAGNRSQAAHRWKKQGLIFGVPHRGDTLYLGFQFGDDGRPLPVIRDVLAAMEGWPPWDIAAWLTVRNDQLDRRRPVDLLLDEPDAVATAARAAAGGWRVLTDVEPSAGVVSSGRISWRR